MAMFLDFIWKGIEWFWEAIIQDIFRGKKSKHDPNDPPAVM